MFASCNPKLSFDDNAIRETNLNQLSFDFLNASRQNKSTIEYKEKLKTLTVSQIQKELITDAQRYSFWINIYNGFIQDILKEKPELYDDRKKFFGAKQLNIMGDMYAFADIEHGILRKSQNEYGLGYIQKWFPAKWERKLRVKKRDYRIHFALNCGAKDCPPIALYKPLRINDQLNNGSDKYLSSSSIYNPQTKTIKITSLFSWFRGDFGGKKGTKKILKTFGIIPKSTNPKLEYKNYDWTLYLDNYIDLD
jgi:hypothetical protein